MFTVTWVRSAVEELAEIWLNADSTLRDRITQATLEIDRQLRRDPLHAGESREENRRILLASPLAVKFRVDTDDAIAQVLTVWQFHSGR